jgi:predicted XRE-type DNA-binding protein
MESQGSSTVLALRQDVAHQIARRLGQLGLSQLAAAKHLAIPQPTVSKIVNGRVADISLELLIRIAVRAGLPLTLQTGQSPEEAGAFISKSPRGVRSQQSSALNAQARATLTRSERDMTPAQRLEAFLEHNCLVAQLRAAGQDAESDRSRRANPT